LKTKSFKGCERIRTAVHYPQNNSYLRTGRKISERIEAWENSLPQFLKLAYLPSPGKVRLRISRGTSKELLEMAIEEYVVSLNLIINDIIVGYEEEETIEFGGDMLKRKVKPYS
jgi:nicotinamide-nucleotide amidase